MNAEDFAARLPGCKKVRQGWVAKCPAHDDNEASLSFTTGSDGRIVLKCFAGCPTEQVVGVMGLTLADLFPDKRTTTGRGGEVVHPTRRTCNTATPPRETPVVPDPTPTGLTLAQYADTKRLDVAFLKGLGLSEISYQGRQAVRIPYHDRGGVEVAVRFRISATGDKFRWRSGAKPCLYGLDRLRGDAANVILVEGESDTQTLLSWGFNALGIPGASNWKDERDAPHLEVFKTVFIVIEPDRGGETVKKWLATSSIRDRVRLVSLDRWKDPSDMHLDDPAQFKARTEKALTTAVPWTELERHDRQAAHDAAGAACYDLARQENILANLVKTLGALGLVGEDRNAQLLYLALTSRVFPRPVSVAVKGPSSGGKSFTVETVLKFFPDAAYYALTSCSEHALAYGDEPLQHRHLVIYEAAGMESDLATYLIRSLLSEGCIRYETVEKSADGLKPKLILREGPTGLVVTTTKVRLHPENETRLLTLTVRDTPDQTSLILQALAGAGRGAVDLVQWVALQQWLGAGEADVVVPYALRLSMLIPPVAVRLRRDFTTLLALVKSHALLHQSTRDRDPDGAVIANMQDYAVVRSLLVDLFAAGVEATVPVIVREVVAVVSDLQGDDQECGATVNEISQRLKLDKSATSRRLHAAADRGFLVNLETRRGRPSRWRTDESMPEDLEVLPHPEALEDCCTVARKPEGVNTPPPPPVVEQAELVEVLI